MSNHRWKGGGGALTRLIPTALFLATSPARADAVDQWRPLIEEASTRFAIPTSWIEQVIRAESRGLTTLGGHPIRSRAGAMGLMQLMPATWQQMRTQLGLGTNPDDPRDNILAGTCFLRLMYDRFGYPGLFGAYNAGPGAYAAYLAGRRQLPDETTAYLASVGSAAVTGPTVPGPAPAPPMFIVRRDVASERLASDQPGGQNMLFVVRKDVP
ncbi:lytic transglycosylase domain-containing protein [Flavisphingomonas formosensis]|uniref:lytic transglycosylase domain-containing protein n=1 Tax=Flavisphingomonas formosensis TaxID=861534 RepID=UPI0012FB2575|nr:lytic transglycosylase domain-containing protein [Sphingomonas formosensis]